MKYFPPLALCILLIGCAVTPEDKEAAHQRQLEKEARENFIAMKAQQHPGRPVVLYDEAPATQQPKMVSSIVKHPSAIAPAAYNPPTPKSRGRRYADDTTYYWQVESVRQRTSPRQQAAELKYARALAKRPENLTPEERTWAHEHY
jgi:hypothetical protein